MLAELWGGDEVQVRRCPDCGLCFAVPFVAGDDVFYNLVSEENPRYPSRRWEFQRTLASLQTLFVDTGERVRLVELGAGDGAFLKLLRASSLGPQLDLVAIEYDRGALERLERSGFTTYRGALADLAEQSPAAFAVFCSFQTLEHVSDIGGLFASISRLLVSAGEVFLSTPYAPATELQEQLTSYWDMPPNHIARWGRPAFERIAETHRFSLVEWELERANRFRVARDLARFRLLARAYNDTSFAAKVNSIRSRTVRGPIKLALSLAFLPRMLAAWPSLLPPTQWAHLRCDRAR